MLPRDLALRVCIASIRQAEGGLSNHPQDRGGLTNSGITQRSWDDYRRRQGLASFPISQLTEPQITEFYEWYLTHSSWQDVRKVQPLVPMVMLGHMLFLHGHLTGARVFQRALAFASGQQLTIDGMIGDQSLAAIASTRPVHLVTELERTWRKHFFAIVVANPLQQVFLNGWLNRAAGWSTGEKP